MPEPKTCTYGPSASTGERCGKPAVSWFTSTDGETVYAECADHDTSGLNIGHASALGARVGDIVPVRRYGKTYDAKVVEVGARGAVYATFTYDNGAVRTVKV